VADAVTFFDALSNSVDVDIFLIDTLGRKDEKIKYCCPSHDHVVLHG